MLKLILISMRPKQWTKNLVLFAGVVFAQKLRVPIMVMRAIIAFIIFCLVTGGVYIINDIFDRKQDLQHPKKKNRPIASGKLSIKTATIAALLILSISLTSSFFLNTLFGISTLVYLIIMLLYSFYLKHIVILDIVIIALGFVLRAYAGVVVNPGVTFSKWLLICTLFLALFLAISKRRHELISLEEDAVEHRLVLQEYSASFLDQMIAVVTSTTIVSYALYTVSEETVAKFHTHSLIFTFPFVVYGILRYLYLVYTRGEGGDPENILLRDKPLLIDILLWLILVITILYFPTHFDNIFRLGGS